MKAVDIDEDRAVVTKRHTHRLKLRDSTANAVLARAHPDWGQVLRVIPAESHASRVEVRNHGEAHRQRQAPVVEVPERYLREYRGPFVTHRQVAYTDRLFLPDTFRHPMTSLKSNALLSVDAYTARLKRRPEPAVELAGPYFYLDTEHPGHFGHVITEVIGRAAGWTRAVAAYPNIRPLISLRKDQDSLPSFQETMFRALGIDPESITYIRPGQAYRVETLVAETPGFIMPFFVAPELVTIWEEMGQRMADPTVSGAPRLFISRRAGSRRHCRQTPEVEAFFADEGFMVVYPEDLPFAEQVARFRSAEIVAGFAGSGLFTSMFSPVRRRILIASSSYTANNEYLIAAVQGGTLDIFWGPGDVPQPGVGFDLAAFQSDYEFDVARHADALRRAIDGDQRR